MATDNRRQATHEQGIMDMHRLFIRPLLIATAFFHVAPLFAAGQSEDARPGSVAEWVEQVNVKLYRSMAVGDSLTGAAVVTFRRGADGYPEAVQVHEASPPIDRAARETLRRARQLPPLPSGVNPNQLIRVQLLFSGDEDQKVYLAKRHAMLAAADETNRRFDAKRVPTIGAGRPQ